MTVKELIEKLQTFQQDTMVVCDCYEITDVKLITEYYLGDSANPNCEVVEAVELI